MRCSRTPTCTDASHCDALACSPVLAGRAASPRRFAADTHRFVPDAVLQHLLVRASAGAAHQAGRPRRSPRRSTPAASTRHGKQRGARARIRRPVRSTSRAPSRATSWSSRSRRSRPTAPPAYSSSLLAPYTVDPASIASAAGPRAAAGQLAASTRRPASRALADPDVRPADHAAAAADARLRRRGAGAQGSDRPRRRRAPSAATWTTPA